MSKLPSLPSFESPPAPIKEEVRQLVHRLAGVSSPDAADTEALAKHIRNYPEIASFFPDLDQHVEELILKHMTSEPIRYAVTQTQITRMELDLGFETASATERLLINAVISAWLLYQHTVSLYMINVPISRTVPERKYWEDRLDAAQRRHLRAIDSLTRTRKLLAKSPPVQVNIAAAGGQQVNITGHES